MELQKNFPNSDRAIIVDQRRDRTLHHQKFYQTGRNYITVKQLLRYSFLQLG